MKIQTGRAGRGYEAILKRKIVKQKNKYIKIVNMKPGVGELETSFLQPDYVSLLGKVWQHEELEEW